MYRLRYYRAYADWRIGVWLSLRGEKPLAIGFISITEDEANALAEGLRNEGYVVELAIGTSTRLTVSKSSERADQSPEAVEEVEAEEVMPPPLPADGDEVPIDQQVEDFAPPPSYDD
ncbi:MAG TPA: hypothetical protein VMX18_02440 [Candidatus Bipolaricaulota bacterium]|nr:hypothetical protein [Candidatus Bipolaricaulota bacterium]